MKKKKTASKAARKIEAIAGSVRDRVIEQRKVTAAELAANPKNFRKHPQKQVLALRGALEEIGYAGAALAYYSESAGGALTLIDGHLRRDQLGPAFQMACTILDLNDAEADKLLASFDALAGLAETDAAKFDTLLRDMQTGSEDLAQLFTEMSEAAGLFTSAEEESESPSEEEDAEPIPAEKWGVYIDCDNEAQQKELLERLGGEGLRVKGLIV